MGLFSSAVLLVFAESDAQYMTVNTRPKLFVGQNPSSEFVSTFHR